MDLNYNNEVINQQRFYAGQSIDEKLGVPGSFQYSRGLDWRKNPAQLIQAMQPRQISAGNMDDMIVNMVQAPTGERFGIGKNGSFYLITATNTVTKIGTIGEPAGFGLVYFQPTDSIYITGQNSIHRYSPVSDSSTRSLQRDFISSNTSTNVAGSFPSVRSNGTETYEVQTSYDEGNSHKLNFTSDIEPLIALILNVYETGSGDWDIEIHDPTDRVVASKTISSSDITTGKNEFTFSQAELLVKPNAMIYHAHVKESSGTGKLRCSEKNNLNTADFELRADRLVETVNGYHPAVQFLQYLAVQNGRYLALWEPLSETPDNSEFQRHRLTYPDGYEGCGIDSTDEFLIQAMEKRSTDTDREFQEGLLGFWDGLSPGYNFYIRIKEGAPEAIYVKDNVPHFIIGGTLYVWLGGKTLTKIRDLPKIDNDFTGVKDITRAYPYIMTSFKKMLHFGYPSVTANTDLEFGVYNFGSLSNDFDPSFGYQYSLSHGSVNRSDETELEIGYVGAYGDEMYISWLQGSKAGLDIVDSNCKVSSYFKFTALRFDAQNTHKLKGANKVVVTTNALPEGTTLFLYRKLDDGLEVPISTSSATGSKQHVLNVDGDRFNEIDYGFYGTSEDTVTTPLKIKAIALEWDANKDEDFINAE